MDNIFEFRIINYKIKYNKMKKTIDWDITGTWLANKWKLNITYIDGSKETIVDTISNLMKKTKTLC